MLKHICDICNTNEATNRFKIKKLIDVAEIDEHGVFPKKEWVDIDICTACLIDICQAKKSVCDDNNKDRIWVSKGVYERIKTNPKGVIFETTYEKPIIWKGSVKDN